MSRRARHLCACIGIAVLTSWVGVACGLAEASYEGHTATASQSNGGEFAPPASDADAGANSVPPPATPGLGDADAGASGPQGASPDAAGTSQPPPGEPESAAPDAGPATEAPPPELCEAEICDGVDNDCDGQVDEGLRNACGECGPPPAEVCNNGRDDDCDGRTDCDDTECGGDCVVTCEEFEGHNCNTDMGYGDHCAPEDNWGGCAPERFWAWCNRRNPAYGEIWDDHLRDWVAERCDSTILLEDLDGNGYDEFTCTSDEGVLYRCTTPLVLALDPAQPVRYRHEPGALDFDLSAAGDGSAVATAWPTAATPWLARDRDGDGRITSGRELFGSATLTRGGLARHGFAALAELDHDGNGQIDARDPAFAELLLWFDDDGDRISAAHELLPVDALGVQALGLEVQIQARCDGAGNCERERSWLRWVDGAGQAHSGALIDVHLRVGADPAPRCL